MSGSILLIGAKGVAKRVLDAIEEQGLYSKIAILDGYVDYDSVYSYPIIGKSDELEEHKKDFSHALVCIADTSTRSHYLQRVLDAGFEVPNIIHPRAYVSKSVEMGIGVIINAMAAVQAGTLLGNGCLVETGVVVEHDNKLGECVTIAPGASTMGFVKIGDKTFVGGAACIINSICIGENSLVAAGSVVTEDVPEGVLVAGCPAKVKRPVTEMKHMIWPGVYPEGRY